jgi:ribosomal protein L7Ae-like RNA K-turn-binding protein
MVLAPGGEVAFDLAGGAVGRGAWVHPQASCLRKASKVVGQRLSSPDALTGDVLPVMLAAAARRRATGLLLAANRAKLLAVGSHACRQSFLDGKVKLVVLAADALAAGKESWVETATAQGLVVFWSTKAELGGLIGRNELAVLTVLDGGLARSLVRVFAMMIPAASHSAKQTFSAWTTGLHGSQDSEDG